ncbi:DUF7507 domain-containing protein [Flavobacterium hungaricum]|uniref:DUF7507 domain-containing protein n=1 Tax=Flavobacterium hungaricum TaxID=2082725 RepID=A0ABR9TQ03_9FLAO|nr:T9SS sorting signal type C domain-containing protein [Flavobacterium hungaricum]MBE8727445.1 hypothetical protein [Flavobacterium hungaricum]
MSQKLHLHFRSFTMHFLMLSFFLFSIKTTAQLRISRIHTDWKGYWTSNDKTLVNNRPDTANNLLAFQWNGTTYSTGVNDNTLTTQGVTFVPQKFRALKIQSLGYTTDTYFLQGSMIDGSNAVTKLEPPLVGTTATGPELAARLTDGVNGLTLGTGIANIKAGTAEFKIGTNNLNITGIGDGKPDLIVTQVAEPGGTPDKFKFVDAAGNTIGTEISVNFVSIDAVGTYSLDLFRADNGAPAFTAADKRDIRMLGIETSSFGITAANASQVDRFVVTFSGNSDCAFIAFNTESLKIAELSMIKSVSMPSACGKAGDVLTYSFDIKNTGEVPISNISVSDPMAGLTIAGNSIPTLAAGDTRTLTGTYTITPANVSAGKVVNSAKVSGSDPSLNIVEDVSGHSYTDNIATEIILLPPPTLGAITNVGCSNLGSIELSNLPAGSWSVQRTPGGVVTTGTGTTATISNIPVGTAYSFTVTTSSGCKSPSSAPFNIVNQSTTTWDGTAWSQGAPDINKNVVFSGPYTITGNINACALTVSAGVNLVVPTNVTLNVLNAVSVSSTGSLTFENNSSLVQTNNVTNTGNIIYRRITKPVRRYDFTYWSSPIYSSAYTLKSLSSATLADKYYYYDSTNSTWKISYRGEMVMAPGVSYSVRAPQTYSITNAATYLATFTGVPNNGNFSITTIAGNWYLIGNPYPSAISADAFINSNLHTGAIYLWTHNSPPSNAVAGDAKYNYTSSDYAVYTLAGGTGTTAGADRPNGYIAAGQGFFVNSSTATPIVFTNSMRRVGNNTQFYKTAANEDGDKNRLWLNFSNEQGAFKQILLGYMEGATNNIDTNYDAETMNANSYVDFYTISNTNQLTIQARALPFDNTETVPVGYKTTIAGDFTIAINEVDGFFTGQEVYLEDKLLEKIHDLRTSNYTFSSAIGTFTDRFVLRYTNKTLGNEDFESADNNLLVSVKDKIVKVNSLNENIKEVSVYDIAGHLLYNKKKVNETELSIQNLQSSNQVLLVKVTLENDHIVTKKIIFQ